MVHRNPVHVARQSKHTALVIEYYFNVKLLLFLNFLRVSGLVKDEPYKCHIYQHVPHSICCAHTQIGADWSE